MRGLPTRVVFASVLLVALVLAGVVSVYASNRPDGLQRVATDQGLAEHPEQHQVADGPLAGYQLGDGGGRGAAGLVGAVVVLVLASGTTYALRRRTRD